jgi:hypothetical protein
VYTGSRISLIVDVDLPRRMHVYAPGVTGGYIPISYRVDDGGPAWVALPLDVPKPRTLHLKAINETVPVLEKTFRLTRDLVIGQEREVAPALGPNRTLTVKTEFRYQACDDRVCYTPQSVPVEYTFTVRRLDSQRAPRELRGSTAVQ